MAARYIAMDRDGRCHSFHEPPMFDLDAGVWNPQFGDVKFPCQREYWQYTIRDMATMKITDSRAAFAIRPRYKNRRDADRRMNDAKYYARKRKEKYDAESSGTPVVRTFGDR